MNVVIITGFLGSGKTSILIQLAKALGKQGKKVAVIENEVGKTGIDGEALNIDGLKVREIASGCICCTLRLDLRQTMLDLETEYNPDIIFVEPSGVAGPYQVLSTLDGYGGEIESKRILTVIDSSRFSKPELFNMPIVADGVVLATVIAVNKIDLSSKEQLEIVVAKIRESNKDVDIVELNASMEFNVEDFSKLFEIKEIEKELLVKTSLEEKVMPTAVAYVKEFDDLSYTNVDEVKNKLKELMSSIALATDFGEEGREGHIKSAVMTNPNGSIYAGITDTKNEAIFKGWIPESNAKIRRLTINVIIYDVDREIIENAVEKAVEKWIMN